MEIARGVGQSARDAVYSVPDHEMAVGSTLGSPTTQMVIKGTGAIEKVYSVEAGTDVFGSLVVHHWDEQTGIHLDPAVGGMFRLHPEHQERMFDLANGIAVHEDIFVLSGSPRGDGSLDPPAVYYTLELRNDQAEEARIGTYAFCELRGGTERDLDADYDQDLHALIVWNSAHPDLTRLFGCSEPPTGFETTADFAKAVGGTTPGTLANSVRIAEGENLGVFYHSHTLKPGDRVSFSYLLSFSPRGRGAALAAYRACPTADEALERTSAYYRERLGRSVLLTPNPDINRGVLWAKANMLRILLRPPTGWCFVNDPTRSNNSVGRDTAWFGLGADYLEPAFARDSLRAFVQRQEDNGLIVEYYDILDGKTDDYGLNINDNTPLLILALWHHYTATGDEAFLREIYPAAAKAARYILSQRNEQGLVWCTATGTSDWGIIGWRNVMKHVRLSGATTEVNAECYAAMRRVARMAEVLGRRNEHDEFDAEAGALKEAINTHLVNPGNGLYYLNIDVDGTPRAEVTSDLVFPVIFGVASEEMAARIVQRLSSADFWTAAGIRTMPRDAPNYSPGRDPDYGLRGGVWVGVTFWYAFAAARFSPDFMDRALATSFQNYSWDPRRNHTVPGQFSEWLHGETLVNEGMMLSPWFPPRYLWAAIEGAAGLSLDAGDREPRAAVAPLLAPDWKWLGVQHLPYQGRYLTWLAVRTPDLQVYADYAFADPESSVTYEEDIAGQVRADGPDAVALGFRRGDDLLLFVGNTSSHTITSAVHVDDDLHSSYGARVYNSLIGAWLDHERLQAGDLRQGVAVQIERKGFWLLDLRPED